MTDKVQRIRQEIEKRLKCLEEIKLRRELAAAEIGDIACCKYLLSFIDFLQKEPVSEQNLSNVERTGKNWKEPVSEELEEAAKRYATEGDEISGLYVIDEEVYAFKAGANWQEKKDQSIIELAEDHAMLAGMEKMKEEMMEKATEAIVKIDAGGYPYIPQIELYDYDKDVHLAKEGEKYKVILIKEK